MDEWSIFNELMFSGYYFLLRIIGIYLFCAQFRSLSMTFLEGFCDNCFWDIFSCSFLLQLDICSIVFLMHWLCFSNFSPEIRENPFLRQPRIRSSYLTTDAASPDPGKMVCEICEKLLRRKPFLLGSTLSSTEVSVVAVLGCGHAYHADCLEQKTSFEDRRDPHCPLCLGLLPKVEDSREQV